MFKLRVIAAVAAVACVVASSPSRAQGTTTPQDDFGRLVQASPWFYANLGAIIMRRGQPDHGTLVAANPAGTPFLDARNAFKFGWETGIEGTIGIRFWRNEAIEFRFMNVHSDAQNTFTTPGGFIGAGFTGPGGTLFQSDYRNKLRSYEVNWRHQWFEQFATIAGIRQMTVWDALAMKLNGNVATGFYNYNNHLIGPQIGAEFAVFNRMSPFQIILVGKIGTYRLEAEGGIDEFQGNNFIGNFIATEKRRVWAAEGGAAVSYRLTQNIIVRAAYQVLWFDNLNLASNNAAYSLLNPSLLRNPVHDSLLSHGVNFGATITW